ncbi:methyl-accepting chemotaxis protein [Wansuia hejianensis]|nr:methyl-accepting chemotaxis protein [Wansuia hejianensis]
MEGEKIVKESEKKHDSSKKSKKIKFKKLNFKKLDFKKLKFKGSKSQKPESKKSKFNKINFNSIKAKLIMAFSLLIIISSITLGYTSLKEARSLAMVQEEKSLISIAYEGAKLTQSRIQAQLKTLEMVSYRNDIRTMDLDTIIPILKEQVEKTDFREMAIVELDGFAYYSNGEMRQMGKRDNIQKAFKGESSISDLITSAVSGELSIIFTVPVEKDGKVVGALIADADGSTLTNISADTGYGNDGRGFIINNGGTIVGHPDEELVVRRFNPVTASEMKEEYKSYGEVLKNASSRKRGMGEYNYENKEYHIGYAPIEDTEWIFLFEKESDVFLSPIKSIQQKVFGTGFIILIISIVLTYILGDQIIRPMRGAITISNRIADLDLTEDIPEKFISRKDEVGDLSKAFQGIIDNLRHIIDEINSSSDQVAAASQQLMASSQESSTTAEEVARVVEEIAKGASEQAQSTQEGTEKAVALEEIMEKNQMYLAGLNTSSEKVISIVDEGINEVEELSKISEENSMAIKEIHQVILKTDESSQKIGDASEVIASIANQTNLLALNAAIEAARAGEAGRGFAVVAEEIRKLAEQSSASTEEIDRVVKELQDNSKNAVKTMDRVNDITREQSIKVENNKKKYSAIYEAIEYTFNAIEKLNISEENIKEAKDEILNTLQNLSAIAEENSASTQQASASMEEQTASMEEIAGSSEGLAELAQGLNTIIDRFKI